MKGLATNHLRQMSFYVPLGIQGGATGDFLRGARPAPAAPLTIPQSNLQIRAGSESWARVTSACTKRPLQTTQFKEAVGLLQHLVPKEVLILNGHNPLALLHDPLNGQLHTITARSASTRPNTFGAY